jgi:hypothetical protein
LYFLVLIHLLVMAISLGMSRKRLIGFRLVVDLVYIERETQR